ncbi:WxL domain-containing protein [Xylocopilactobacillus apicola]|uniref:WxL domain-containing protein n=1 Tax=Xylocopilactobacillus apicola TaxID=2932184 RepID=A0AAU9DQV3_9LACO|nr:WxL domain-containing protein [Xylocopilactobacillus apicola]BDR59577.1 hypothetical protein XA3_20180 [Xylocopilactobacillus apicola]
MKRNFSKIGSLATVALMATPVLTAISGTTVFAAAAGTGQNGNGTGRVIAENSQSVNTSAIAAGTPASAAGTSVAAVEFYAGDLSLDRVPQFDFGAHELQASVNYNLYSAAPVLGSDYEDVTSTDPKTSDLGLYRTLQVTDRTGGSKGWKITAWATPFKIDGDTTGFQMNPTSISLKGADIELDRSKLVANSTKPDGYAHVYQADGTAADAPGEITANAINFSTDGTVANVTGGVQTIWEAQSGLNTNNVAYGKGTWAADFNKETAATLNLPLDQQTKIGIFKSTINWTLQAGV